MERSINAVTKLQIGLHEIIQIVYSYFKLLFIFSGKMFHFNPPDGIFR